MKLVPTITLSAVLSLMGAASASADDYYYSDYPSSCCAETPRGNDFFASASFLYWQATQDDMELGVVSANAGPLELVNGKVANPTRDFKPGFKLALGIDFDCSRWESVITYTHFHSTQHARVSLDPTDPDVFLLPAWHIPNFLNPHYGFGSETWKLKMDFIDWDFARTFCCDSLRFRPYVGLRGAKIDQSIDVNYINEDILAAFIWPSTNIHQKTDSWGIGPRVGIVGDWNFCNNWNVFGEAEFDILYTEYKIKTSQISDVIYANQYYISAKERTLKAHTELNLGIGWDYSLSDRCHVNLAASYGFQIFFHQDMFRDTSSVDAVGSDSDGNGSLYIQGLTISANLSF